MNTFDRLEKLAQHLIEGPFGRLFKTRLHPADLAKALAEAMTKGLINDGRRTCLAPNMYYVTLSSQDYYTLQKQIILSQEIRAIKRYLTALMAEMHCTAVGPIDVSIEVQADLNSGDIKIRAEHVSIDGVLDPADIPNETASKGDTKRFPKANYLPADHWWLRLPDRRIKLGMPLLKLGRALDNDVIISNHTVSRYHAQLRWQNGFYCVENLSYSQPLTLNSKSIDGCATLKSGDKLQLGLVVLQIELIL